MKSLNRHCIIGNLGQDPDIRHTNSGTVVANLSVATSNQWRDRNGEQQEDTQWHRLVAFGKLAEIIGQYLHKGERHYFEGRVQTRKWQDQSGNDRWTTETVIENLIMLSGPRNGERHEDERRENNEGRGSMQNPQAYVPSDDFDDDIPF